MTVPNPFKPSIDLDFDAPAKSSGGTRALLVAGIILGASYAGFFDGIVLHQLLQWHHMFTGLKTDMTIAGMELNTFGDGLFHAFDLVLNITGLTLLWQAIQSDDAAHSTLLLLSAIVLGFGLFNVTEGVIDHHLLHIHHVKEGPYHTIYDVGFLVINGLIVGLGALMVRSAQTTRL